MKRTFISFLFCIFLPATIQAHTTDEYKADFIIFSFDRPLQLYALLESMETYMTGVGDIRIIYRSSDEAYDAAYDEVKQQFDYALFEQQGANPRQDFKPLTMRCLNNCPHKYVIFAVDDIIVKDFVDLSHTIDAMKQTGAYGFYLRLGHNITFNYPRNVSERLPALQKISDDAYCWKFAGTSYTWRYPNTVDMTLYKKETAIRDFTRMNFSNPNTLEARWASKARSIINKIGLCYEQSKIVNLPLNRVQHTYKNRHMNLATPEELLEIFNQGLKIDITTLFKIKNKSAHMNYNPEFIER